MFISLPLPYVHPLTPIHLIYGTPYIHILLNQQQLGSSPLPSNCTGSRSFTQWSTRGWTRNRLNVLLLVQHKRGTLRRRRGGDRLIMVSLAVSWVRLHLRVVVAQRGLHVVVCSLVRTFGCKVNSISSDSNQSKN